jgi:hypothetical protein
MNAFQPRAGIECHFTEQRSIIDLIEIDPDEIEAGAKRFGGLDKVSEIGWRRWIGVC